MSETILGSSESLLDMGLSSISLTLSLCGLLGPVILSDFLVGEAARRAPLVLNMVAAVSASSAESVDFGVSLTERLSSLTFNHAL